MAWKWKTKLPPIVDSHPRGVAWVSMREKTKWIPRKIGDTKYSGVEQWAYRMDWEKWATQAIWDPIQISNAWFDGRLFDNKAECEVDCSQRNLAEAESLMKEAVGAP